MGPRVALGGWKDRRFECPIGSCWVVLEALVGDEGLMTQKCLGRGVRLAF